VRILRKEIADLFDGHVLREAVLDQRSTPQVGRGVQAQEHEREDRDQDRAARQDEPPPAALDDVELGVPVPAEGVERAPEAHSEPAATAGIASRAALSPSAARPHLTPMT